jgi:hypothetical protein
MLPVTLNGLFNKLNLFIMQKSVKIQKNTITYRNIPNKIALLKWLDDKMVIFLSKLSAMLAWVFVMYCNKISSKIEVLYQEQSIIKIEPKYPRNKKKAK